MDIDSMIWIYFLLVKIRKCNFISRKRTIPTSSDVSIYVFEMSIPYKCIEHVQNVRIRLLSTFPAHILFFYSKFLLSTLNSECNWCFYHLLPALIHEKKHFCTNEIALKSLQLFQIYSVNHIIFLVYFSFFFSCID